jgi:hypothetical protein
MLITEKGLGVICSCACFKEMLADATAYMHILFFELNGRTCAAF